MSAPAPITPHTLAFARALWPDRIRVLGRWLQPLTVGHLLVLVRLRHPLLGGDRPLDLAAVATLCAVCSVPGGRAAGHVGTLRFRLSVAWLMLRGAAGLPRAARNLTRYVLEGTRRPPMDPVVGAGSPSGIPFWVRVLTTLMSDCGMSLDRAMDLPAGAAVWLCLPTWEAGGSIKIPTEEERQAIAEIVAEAKAAEGGKA